MLDEHPKRRAPVADVVLPNNSVAEVVQGAGQRVPNDRCAQMPYVHLLRHVGRGVVDDDGLWLDQRHAEPRIVGHGGGPRRDPFSLEDEVDEAGAADLDVGADPVDVQGGHQACGDVAGAFP